MESTPVSITLSDPPIMAKIVTYMDDELAVVFRRCWEFLKIKTAPCDEQYKKLLGKGEDRICNKILRFKTQHFKNLCVLYGFEGQGDDAFRVLYYAFKPKVPRVQDLSSPQYHTEYKRLMVATAEAELQDESQICFAYFRYLCLHETQLYIDNGIKACFETQSDVRRIREFYINPKDPSDDRYAFEGALILLGLGQFDKARTYIDALAAYARKPYRSGRGAFHPKYYRSAIQFLEELYLARTSTTPAQMRRHIANAIALNFQMVIGCFDNEIASSQFKCGLPAIALSLAVEFEFDPEWSRNCCRAMLWLVNTPYFHDVFRKAVAWDAWMWPPEKFGLLGEKEIDEIARKAWVRNFKRETGN